MHVINFVQNSADKIHAYHGEYTHHAGLLRGPRSGNSVEKAIALNMPWALDNDCFSEYHPKRILRMLYKLRGLPGCKFAVVPDVVQDHEATLLLFKAWIGTYQALGYPPAFVLQNGVTLDTVPWGSISAIFIGGSTAFKYSETVREIVAVAKRHDLWVHIGRVNTPGRIRYSRSIGCDSFDGTACSIAPRKRIAELLPHYTASPTIYQLTIWDTKEIVA